MRFRVTVPLVLFFSLALAGAGEPSDLKQYIAEIRTSMMSESARSSVGTMAGIHLGHTTLEYQEDPASGRYWPSYMSNFCPKPGADPSEVKDIRAELKMAVDQEIKVLRPMADLDDSGFVTSEEGSKLRQLVEFGYLAAAVIENETPTVAAIAKASGLSEAQVRDRLNQYKAFTEAVGKAGLDPFPVVVVER